MANSQICKQSDELANDLLEITSDTDYSEKIELSLQSIEKNIKQMKIDRANNKSNTRNKRQKNKISLKSYNEDQKEIEKVKNDEKKPMKIWAGREYNPNSNTQNPKNIQRKPYYERFTIKNRLPLDDIKKLMASVDEFEENQKSKGSRTNSRRSSLTQSDNGMINDTKLNSPKVDLNTISSRTTKRITRRSTRNQNFTSLNMESSEQSLNINFAQKPQNEASHNERVKKRSSYLLVSVEKLNIDEKISEYEKTIDVNCNNNKKK